jgi:hypothetical protein
MLVKAARTKDLSSDSLRQRDPPATQDCPSWGAGQDWAVPPTPPGPSAPGVLGERPSGLTADLARAGVELAPARTVGVRGGLPVLDGGRVLEVANVVWCTGFRQDFSWIDLPVTGDDGWPLETRGVVPASPGLYFVGLAFQYAFAWTACWTRPDIAIGRSGREPRPRAPRNCG